MSTSEQWSCYKQELKYKQQYYLYYGNTVGKKNQN